MRTALATWKNTGRRRRTGRQNRRPGRKRRLESGKTDPRELGKLKVPEVPYGPAALEGDPAETPLKRSIKKGMIQAAETAARNALLSADALTVINREMIPALDEVGKGFEAGTVFLPQLLMSAEAARAAFGIMKEKMTKDGVERENRGAVILATVKGDIHDIGKNIVKVRAGKLWVPGDGSGERRAAGDHCRRRCGGPCPCGGTERPYDNHGPCHGEDASGF